MSNSVSDAFCERLRQARGEQEARAVEMVFAGFPCKVIPLPLNVWMRSGRMPEGLTNRYLAAASSGNDNAAPTLTPAEALEASTFRRKAVCRVMVEPRIVEDGDPGRDGYLFADIAETSPEFVAAVYDWISLGCPLGQEGGEGEKLGAEDLGKFPAKAQSGKRAGARTRRKGGRA